MPEDARMTHLPKPDDPLPRRCSTETRRALEAARQLVAPEAECATSERNRELAGSLSIIFRTLAKRDKEQHSA